jgi:hypothetical protein
MLDDLRQLSAIIGLEPFTILTAKSLAAHLVLSASAYGYQQSTQQTGLLAVRAVLFAYNAPFAIRVIAP